MNSVPKFIRLLYDALETSAYTFLHWDERGTSFRVSLTQLAKNLDHLFGKISIGTFVKQMNNYKFKVQKVSKDIKIYSNKNFIKGNKQELQKLHRRVIITREPEENSLEAIQFENLKLCQKLMEMKQNQDRLVKSLFLNYEIYKLLVNRIYNIYLRLSKQFNLDPSVQVQDSTTQLFFNLVSGSQPRLREILSFFMIEAIEPMCQWEYDVDGLADCIFEV